MIATPGPFRELRPLTPMVGGANITGPVTSAQECTSVRPEIAGRGATAREPLQGGVGAPKKRRSNRQREGWWCVPAPAVGLTPTSAPRETAR
jgi:hypothetical protein